MSFPLSDIAEALNKQAALMERLAKECGNPVLPPKRGRVRRPHCCFYHVKIEHPNHHVIHLRLYQLPDPLLDGEPWVQLDDVRVGRLEIELSIEENGNEHQVALLWRQLGDDDFHLEIAPDEPLVQRQGQTPLGVLIKRGHLSADRTIELINKFVEFDYPDPEELAK